MRAAARPNNITQTTPIILAQHNSILGTIRQSITLPMAAKDVIITKAIFRVTDARNVTQPPNVAIGTNAVEDNIMSTHTMCGVTNTGDTYSIDIGPKSETAKKEDVIRLTIVAPAQATQYTMSCTIIGIPVNAATQPKIIRQPITPSPKQILKQHKHANECLKEEKIAISRERIAIQCAKYEMLSTCVRWIATAATLSSGMYFFF